jgi:putative ABC transport system permease protein
MIGNIIKFAWRNIWRNKKRTYFTLFAVALGVMAVICLTSYVRGIVNSAGEEMIKSQIGHVRIAHKEFLRLERILPREYRVMDPGALKKEISGVPGIELWCERLKINVLVNSREMNESAAAIGVDPTATDKSMGLSKLLVEGNYFNDSGLNLIIGKTLAQKMKINVNDELLLVTTDINYSTYALPFKVVGIFETGYPSIDSHNLYIPLKKAQEMLDCGESVHEILLFLKEPGKAAAVSGEIESILSEKSPGNPLQVTPWEKDDFIEKFLPVLKDIIQKVLFIFMVIVAIVILNTMLMAVMERYHEIGIIKALGFKDREVVLMVMAEAFFIGVIGSAIGGLVGGVISAVLEKVGIDFTQLMGEEAWNKIDTDVPLLSNIIHPDFSSDILFGAVIFGIIISLAAVLYPAFKSTRMQPAEAFRTKLKI